MSGKKPIEIWMEGYAATGEMGTANSLGTFSAIDFDDAVEQYKALNLSLPPASIPVPYTRESFTSDEAYENRRSDWKIWGCALFNNEADARKSFG